MILLDPVVEITVGPMAHTFSELGLDRFWIAVVPIRRDPGRRDAGDRLADSKNALAAAMPRVSSSLTSNSAPEVWIARSR